MRGFAFVWEFENISFTIKTKVEMSNQVEGQSVSPNDAKPVVSSIQEFLEQKLIRKMQLAAVNVDGPEAREERLKQIEALQIVLQMIEDE